MNKNLPFKKDDLFFLDDITLFCTESNAGGQVFILEEKAKMLVKSLSTYGFFEQRSSYQLGYIIETNQAYLVAKLIGNINDNDFLSSFQQQIHTLFEDLTFISEASKTDTTIINMMDDNNLKDDALLTGGAKKIDGEIIYKDNMHIQRLENLQKLLKKNDVNIFGRRFEAISTRSPELVKKTASEDNVLIKLYLASVEYLNENEPPQLKFWTSPESIGVGKTTVAFNFRENDLFEKITLKDFALMLCFPPSKRPAIMALANIHKKYDLKSGAKLIHKIDILEFKNVPSICS